MGLFGIGNRASGFNSFHNILQTFLQIPFGSSRSSIKNMFPIYDLEEGYNFIKLTHESQSMNFQCIYRFGLQSGYLNEINIEITGANSNLPKRGNELIASAATQPYNHCIDQLKHMHVILFHYNLTQVALTSSDQGSEYTLNLQIACKGEFIPERSSEYLLPVNYVYSR